MGKLYCHVTDDTNAMYEEMRKFEERWRLQGIWKAISRNLSSLW